MPAPPMQRAGHTHWLTHASFEPVAHDALRRWLKWGAVALLALLFVAASRGVVADLFDLTTARTEQALLLAETERLRSQLAVESATRRQLEQHAAELSAEVEELARQVEFLSARKGSAAR